MFPRSVGDLRSTCLCGQWRTISQSQRGLRTHTSWKFLQPEAKVLRTNRVRAFHATNRHLQTNVSPSSIDPPVNSDSNPTLAPRTPQLPIRAHLEKWQELYGTPNEDTLAAFEKHPARSDIQNGLGKLSNKSKAGENAVETSWGLAEREAADQRVTIGLFLKPGDVVELAQTGREPVLAVFVQQISSLSQFFTIDGRWAHSKLARVAFAVPGCIDPTLVETLLPFLPTDPDHANPKGEVHVPAEAAAPILEILDEMTASAERIYRSNAAVLDSAYAKLADTDSTRMMTLNQIAKTLLGSNDPKWKADPSTLLAVRKALLHNEYRFPTDKRSHRMTSIFAIRPKKEVEDIETVHGWIRDHREDLASCASERGLEKNPPPKKKRQGIQNVRDFVDKSRRLIAFSRKDRNPHLGNVGPSKARFSLRDHSAVIRPVFGEIFSESDRKIINFLQAWVLTGQFQNIGGLHAACTGLVLETGCYEPGTVQHISEATTHADSIQRATGALFLQEIGVITPYEDIAVYHEHLMLPTIRPTRNLDLLNTKAEALRKKPDFQDSMADMRHDWGTTTVYCIDDAGAHEIDDGISVERVENSDSEFWVHVHVANPTAFFDKSHALSGLAAHMGESVYTPERMFPMIPLWAVQDFFSMECDRPVITFSSRIDSTGAVQETKIQHGIVHNVISITPAEVSTVLGEDITLEKRKLVVGGDIPPQPTRSPPKLDSKQVRELEDLYAIAGKLWERRKAANSIRITTPSSSVRVYENRKSSGLTWHKPSLDKSRTFQGDPIIEVSNTIPKRYIEFDIKATNIVEEMMLLAGQTAASWCAERNIPIMYRGTIEIPTTDGTSSEEYEQKFVQPYLEKHGDLSLSLALGYMQSRGRAVAHFQPLPHRVIGASGYAKVTSPLRRFSDMMSHWQIEAAIRYEARTGKKLDAIRVQAAESGLPFSLRQMQESIVTLQPKEAIIRATKQSSAAYWTALAFMRAFCYKEAELPATFKCSINFVSGSGGPPAGQIPEYGIRVTMVNGEEARFGDEWEVAIDHVDLFKAKIYVKPIRLLYREPQWEERQ